MVCFEVSFRDHHQICPLTPLPAPLSHNSRDVNDNTHLLSQVVRSPLSVVGDRDHFRGGDQSFTGRRIGPDFEESPCVIFRPHKKYGSGTVLWKSEVGNSAF